MPKRKRSAQPTLQSELEKFQTEVFRALKAAKGFERQRLSKRVRETDIPPAKQERLEREIAVLKSLDLHQTARAHLCSSLLKLKSIAASTDVADELRTGVPKPDISEEEKAALHNVTSGLYNRDQVKKVIDNAITAVCEVIGVPIPQKTKKSKKDKLADKEEEPAEQTALEAVKDGSAVVPNASQAGDNEDVTDFEGCESDVDEPGPAVGEPNEEAEAEEESEYTKFDDLLGSSSDEDEEGFDAERFNKFRGTEKVNLDDISASGSDADSGSESEMESTGESPSESSPPPPAKKVKESKESKPAKASTKITPAKGSTFLPSLMGGYISGSESASDVDVAPAKKRRGQRARQAIWEEKYGAKANHVQNEAKQGKRGRDSGWDMKRGAVDGDDDGRRTPWKKGVRAPMTRGGREMVEEAPPPPPRPTKRDDEGTLHPSWEARKKAKTQKDASFAGQKIVFD